MERDRHQLDRRGVAEINGTFAGSGGAFVGAAGGTVTVTQARRPAACRCPNLS